MPNHQLVVFNNHLYNAADDANLYVYGPEVTTDAASLVTGMTAVLNGNLVDGVGEVCDCGFEWGLTPAYGHTTPTTPQNTGDSFAQLIAGLLPATTYHFRAFATNTAGTNDGSDMIFTTPIFVLPPPNLSYPISRRKL